jgi:uncharacterized membrane protein YfcA
MIPLELAPGFGIGLSLGVLGGGSLLTVPAPVYLVGQTPQAAVTTSLALVGAKSKVAAPLAQKGFKTVYNVSGGISAWMHSGLALERPWFIIIDERKS